jgi:hypothetical protein
MAMIGVLSGPALAQLHQNEILPRTVMDTIAGEVSGKIAFEHIRDLGIYSRWYGSDDMEKAADFIVDRAGLYGLSDVRKERFPVDRDTYYWMQKPWLAWNCEIGELRILEPERRLIASYEANTTCVLVYSRDTDIEAEVIYVGKGVDPSDYEGKDLRGKVVLAYGNPWDVSKAAVFRYGAAGILSCPALGRPGPASTEIGQMRIKPWSEDGAKESTFGFSLSANQGNEMMRYLESGKKVLVKARIKAEVRVPGNHVGVTATIRGTDYPDEEIILTAHLDHPRPGAHDDNSGCATLLEVARTLNTLIAQKAIAAPKRTLRFYWTPHVWGLHMLFSKYPELLKKTLAGINVDCVGLDQMKFSTRFSVVLPPHSRASWLGDVMENTLDYVSLANNAAKWGLRKYGPEIIDHDGSQNVFWGRAVPFTGYSDHVFLNSGDVGIPTVMLIDMPFGSHHSQNDELELLDPTQLKRVCFLTAVSAYTIAAIGPEGSYRLIDEVYHKARIRLEHEMKLAKSILYRSPKERMEEDFGAVDNMVLHGFRREHQALHSTRVFAKGDAGVLNYVERMEAKIREFEKESRADLSVFRQTRAAMPGLGEGSLQPEYSPEENKMKRIVPKRNPELLGDFGSLNEYPVERYQLQSIMPDHPYYFELLSLMDGKRNMLDILRFVQAEALSVNYEPLSFDQVREYLGLLKEAGIISY